MKDISFYTIVKKHKQTCITIPKILAEEIPEGKYIIKMEYIDGTK